MARLLTTLAHAALLTLASVGMAAAAELVMFERDGCPWCAKFDREVGPTYPKTAEGARAPLRRVNVYRPLPADLASIKVERLTPLFVLIEDGREIGRIRGYPGDDLFWTQMTALMHRLDEAQLAKR